jgi:hypothetical protein
MYCVKWIYRDYMFKKFTFPEFIITVMHLKFVSLLTIPCVVFYFKFFSSRAYHRHTSLVDFQIGEAKHFVQTFLHSSHLIKGKIEERLFYLVFVHQRDNTGLLWSMKVERVNAARCKPNANVYIRNRLISS